VAITVVAMVATPLAPARGPLRRILSSVTVTGLCMSSLTRSIARWGRFPALTAAAAVAAGTTLIEHIGPRTGKPFGRYHYTDALQPQVAGVPVIVPAAWFAMAVPAREVAHGALGTRSTRLRRVVLGSFALTAWDLFLDPQMTTEGYWQWDKPGRYRGIPLSNYVGWFVTGLAVMAVLEVVMPPGGGRRGTETQGADGFLVGQYAYMGVMETVGFAAFFRDRVVALAGGTAMLPIAFLAVWSRVSQAATHRASQ
jgi:putative membrane protein